MVHIPGEPELIARLTMPFMLVGFFFVAGVTFNVKNNFISFINTKFKRFVFPVFAFGILNTILAIPCRNFDILERLKGVFLQIPGNWDDMWFVACLFIMELIFYPIERFIKKSWLKIAASMLICCVGIFWTVTISTPLPWHIINAMMFLPFLTAGKILASNGALNYLDKAISCNVLLSFFPILTYCLSVLVVRNWPVDIHLLIFGNPFLYIISAITGLLSVVCISIVLNKPTFKPINRILIFIGTNTLIFYGLQSKAISVFNTIFNKISPLFPQEINVIWVFVLICVIPLMAVASIVINRWFPFMTGDFKSIKHWK